MSMLTVADSVVFDAQTVRRFDINGPRYTSYPTADRFVPLVPDRGQYWLSRRAAGKKEALSLYFHLPFCPTICYYCACNKIITKDHGRSAKYLRYIAREIALQRRFLAGDDNLVEQLHWGGGTPTFLSHDEMRQLMAATRRHFRLHEGGEYSIEVDPRKVDADTVKLLGELGFNRMSVGVQDFDTAVQQVINRRQSEEETFSVIAAARANGFRSVSIDLIYGLPRQSVESFARTLERTLAAAPDRLSIYNYAHLPGLFKPQRRIPEADLPTAEARLQILALAIRTLTDAGYVFIGMDHFAKPEDDLAVAQREGRLHRNFQGYSTFPECDMLAFGISAISQVGSAYYQNFKTLDTYYSALDRGELPIFRGIELDADDRLRRTVIQGLMCHFALDFAAVEAVAQREFGHVAPYHQGADGPGFDGFETYFAAELRALADMIEAGLLTIKNRRLRVLPKGRMLIRGIAMVFDRRLRADRERRRYSRVI